MAPRKRSPEEISSLREPVLSEEQEKELERGIDLFNAGRYWHAHEAWEHVWLAMSDHPDDDAEIILRGLIQMTAGFHLVGMGRIDGAVSNLGKARAKLALAPDNFLDIDIAGLLQAIERQQATPEHPVRAGMVRRSDLP